MGSWEFKELLLNLAVLVPILKTSVQFVVLLQSKSRIYFLYRNFKLLVYVFDQFHIVFFISRELLMKSLFYLL